MFNLIRKCICCGVEFEVSPMSRTRRKYCSNHCTFIYNKVINLKSTDGLSPKEIKCYNYIHEVVIDDPDERFIV